MLFAPPVFVPDRDDKIMMNDDAMDNMDGSCPFLSRCCCCRPSASSPSGASNDGFFV